MKEPPNFLQLRLAEAADPLITAPSSSWLGSFEPVIMTLLALLLLGGGLWALLLYRRSKRREAARWMHDILLRFQLAPEFERAKLIFEFHYREVVEPIHAVLAAADRSALHPDKRCDSQQIDRLLDYLEQIVYLADNGHVSWNDCLACFKSWFELLSEPERGALRRYLARRGYERLARIAGAEPDDFLLLYGSLAGREPLHAQLGLDKALQLVGAREIQGALYDLGEYPGLVLGSGLVQAELFKIKDTSVLRRLDEHEEYDHASVERSLFRRTTIQLPRHASPLANRLRGNPMIDAWIYVYNQPTDGKQKLDARSWQEYKRRRRDSDLPSMQF